MRRVPLLGLVLAACSGPAAEDVASTEATSPSDPFDVGPIFGTWIPEDYAPVAPQQVIFFGDSVTVGEGAGSGLAYNELLQSNDDAAWPESAGEDFETLFGGIPVVYDVAKGGAMTGSVVNWQLPDLDAQLPEVVNGETLVVATIGGNDMVLAVFASQVADDPVAVAQEEVDKMVANLNEIAAFFDDPVRFPDPVFLYIANVYEPTDTIGQSVACFNNVDVTIGIGSIDLANQAMLGVAQEYGYGYVDMRSHYLGHGHNAGDATNPWHHPDDATTWFVDDCIHPNERGHHEIRRLFHGAISGEPLSPPEAL